MSAAAQHAALKAAYFGARACEGTERAGYLAGLEPGLRDAVEALLAAGAGADDGVEDARAARAFVDPSGRWRALEVLGEGGMGVVYRGERADGEYAQQVAIKSLSGAGTRLAVARSRRERQFLARLVHPHIARLLDGGRDACGAPFLVMELIDGEAIDAWCARHDCDAATRIRLIAVVARAVAHAHRQLVVHRDLKPGNILVDRAGQPKLLDFGIAGSLEPDGGDDTLDAPPALTPAYASPERLAGERGGIAGDVYALGVILHELLSGTLPYRAERRDRVALIAAIRGGAEPRSLARLPRQRGGRALGREIDDILARALAREPGQRYADADAFAADLEALLAGGVVRARPPSLGYRLRIEWRRRWPVYATAVLVVALTAVYAHSLLQQLERTARERDRARANADFLVQVFQSAEPRRVVSGEASARELLERAWDELERGNPPSVDARDRPDLYQTLGAVQYQLGLLDDSERSFARAIALRETDPAHDPRSMATHLNALAAVRRQRGDLDGAAALVRRALAARERAGDTAGPEYANLLNSHAILLDQLGRNEAARITFEQAIARYRALGPTAVEGLAGALNNYGTLLARRGAYAECVAVQREAIAAFAPLLRTEHPRHVDLLGDLAHCLYGAGAVDEAAAHYARALALGAEVLPADDLVLARVRADHARLLHARGERDSALAAIDAALAVFERRLDPSHPLRVEHAARRAALVDAPPAREQPAGDGRGQRQ